VYGAFRNVFAISGQWGNGSFHDIVTHQQERNVKSRGFWNEIKQTTASEFVEWRAQRESDCGTGAPMETSGIGRLFMP